MTPDNEDTLALPLWINGHAYLTMADAFLDVINPKTGELLRRTPLCGADAAGKAVAAAQAALPKWALDPDEQREAKLLPIADARTKHADKHREEHQRHGRGDRKTVGVARLGRVVRLVIGSLSWFGTLRWIDRRLDLRLALGSGIEIVLRLA